MLCLNVVYYMGTFLRYDRKVARCKLQKVDGYVVSVTKTFSGIG